MVKASHDTGSSTARRSTALSPKRSAEFNKHAILDYIRTHSPVSRTEIWSKVGLSRAAVTLIIRQLLAAGLVVEQGRGESRGGRRPVLLEFSRDARVILAYSWHHRKLVAVNLASEVLAERLVRIAPTANPESFVGELGSAIRDFVASAGIERDRIAGLGLVMPGLIAGSRKGQVVLSTAQGWHNVPLGELLERETGFPTSVEADAFVDAFGEYLGDQVHAKTFVLFGVEETGIGIAMVENGRLWKGSNGLLGEVGHIRLSETGPVCACGKRGCLQALVLAAVEENGGSWLGKPARYVGWGIALIVNILDPRTVVVAGPVVSGAEGKEFYEAARRAALESILDAEEREIEIRPAVLGEAAWIGGIAGLVYDRVFESG